MWLDELGHLTCSYLGTDPTFFTASTRGKRGLNYQVGVVIREHVTVICLFGFLEQEVDKELSEMNRVIRNSQKGMLTSLYIYSTEAG